MTTPNESLLKQAYEPSYFERLFNAACVDLGLINEALGLDPNDGGAGPILDAIQDLKNAAIAQPEQPTTEPESKA